MRRAARLLIAVGATVIVLAVAGRLVLTALMPSPPAPAHLSAGGYLGVAEPGETASYQAVTSFAASVGRQPDIVLFYNDWGEPFQSQFAAQVHAHGATPFVQIEPQRASLAAIASGAGDAYLRAYARQVRAYGRPVVIGFGAEMNGYWDSWGYGHTSPAVFVAAWRHIVTLFRAHGADNVIWLWTVNVTEPGTGPIEDWWPGASYVTWVGIDGYYYRRSYTFNDAFLPTIAEVRIFTGQPILLSEIGIGPVAGQAAKRPDLFTGVRANHLLGLVWFDESQGGDIYHQDWRLEPNSAGLAAFRRQLKTYREPATGPAVPALTTASASGRAGRSGGTTR
ncbi:MAG TPA: glycosyl hydrolase [Streptosporangiaceae bacterium]